MTRIRHIAVIDVGKTNAKLALVDAATLQELAVVTRPNRVLAGPPWPHFDLEGHWAFFLEALKSFQASHGIDGISVTTHGASAVLLDAAGELAAPMLDYEHDGPDSLAGAYDAIRPDFAETGSPRLAMGLNLGAQLFWQFRQDRGLAERTAHVVTYPQYWGYRLTGRFATDVTSLGCHTDLWAPQEGRFSSLVEALGLAGKIPEPRKSGDVLGTVTPAVCAATGLTLDTPVLCGIHDSNASLFPHLAGRQGAFSVVSTGTWLVAMSIGGETPYLSAARDTLVNVNALGQPVPSARYMGGRAYEVIREGCTATPKDEDLKAVLRDGVMLMPSVVRESGPFPGRRHCWTRRPANDAQRMAALSWYLALMTRTCLDLTGAAGPVIVEGPFAANSAYTEMLAALSPEGVELSTSATGTSTGAAMLFAEAQVAPRTRSVTPRDAAALRAYAAAWQAEVSELALG